MPSLAQNLRARRELIKAAGGRVSRRRFPKPLYPSGERLRYYRKVKRLVSLVRRITEDTLLPELPSIVELAELERGGVRRDTSVDLIARTFSSMRILMGAGVDAENLEDFMADTAGRINVRNRTSTQRQFRAVLGVDLIQAEQNLGPPVEAFVRQNVGLVKSVPEELLGRLENQVLGDVRSGLRVEEISRNIRGQFGVAESRANLIARDQVGKLNAQLTRQRHQNVGIVEYIWSTSNDERVRKRHAELDGTTQQYAKPPIVDPKSGRRANPGEDYQCRCNALPVFPEELLEAAGISEQPAKVSRRAGPAHVQAPKVPVFRGTVHHGTDSPPFREFDSEKFGTATDSGLLGRGAYFSTDPQISRSNKTHITADVELRKPLRVAMEDWGSDKSKLVSEALGLDETLQGQPLTEALQRAGYDGVILDYSAVGYAHQEIMVIKVGSIRVKSAGDVSRRGVPRAARSGLS